LQLSDQVRKQCHVSRALDGVRELALVPLTHAGPLPRDDLSERGQVAPKRVRVLVVNRVDVLLAEITLPINLFYVCHNRGSRVPDRMVPNESMRTRLVMAIMIRLRVMKRDEMRSAGAQNNRRRIGIRRGLFWAKREQLALFIARFKMECLQL
jgi:hypothetical protein